MPFTSKLIRLFRIFRAFYVRRFIHFARKIKLPGFQGVSLWEIIFFFLYSIRKGLIGMRAAAVSFHFFLALIPFGLVLVVLTSYTPGLSLEADIAPVISALIPDQLFSRFMASLDQYHQSTVNSWVSVGFILALYFTSNGFTVLIRAFNSSRMDFKKRKWWSVRLVSFSFVILFLAGIITVFYSIILVRMGLVLWSNNADFIADYFDAIYVGIDLLFLGLLLYFGVALMYYLGPQNRKQFRFFSPGATLATLLIMIISVLYELYVAYYANYNELYGSLGTVLMLLLWIYLISYSLIIGFELNASIHGAITNKSLRKLKDLENRYNESVS